MGLVDLTEVEVGDRGRVKGGDLDFGLIEWTEGFPFDTS